MKTSIIIPCFNEVNTIEILINKIKKQKNIDKEIILVDDFSIDGTRNLIKNRIFLTVDHVIFHKKNLGKGACIKSAIKKITGDIVIIQDADLEYDPNDYQKLIQPIKDNLCEVVYGSRVLNKKRYFAKGFYSISRIFFNHVLTIISNIINNQKLTDAHTCYKVFKKELFVKLNLKENGFSFCPEVTTKISNLGIKILEVPINYQGRTYKEGKKINYLDGFRALIAILRYKIL
jgi:glycosyltransferase involved in cell wall biosynthesis